MHLVGVMLHIVVEAEHFSRKRIAGSGTAESDGELACRIEALAAGLHVARESLAEYAPFESPLLVANRPQDHAGMVAVAHDHAPKLIHVFGSSSHLPVFIQHQHAQTVAGIQQLRRGRIVRGANRIRAHGLEVTHAKFVQSIGNRDTNARVVLVVVGALELYPLAVQEESVLRIEANGSYTEAGLAAVHHFVPNADGRDQLVEERIL